VARTRSPERLQEIVDAALEVFLEQGYRRAHMAHIARVAAVSPGLIYSYAEGKEALFALVLQRELGADIRATPLPFPNPDPAEVDALVRHALRDVSKIPTLDAAAEIERPADARAELAAIVGEHYDRVARYRRVIKLVERSALDWPELADRFYVRGRRPFVRRLGEHIARRVASGDLAAVPDPDVAARYVIEVVAWFANHRHGDRDGRSIDEGTSRATVIELVTRSLAAS
jgi:AcrR family transcriptional regulator